jgi:hypothetical protein
MQNVNFDDAQFQKSPFSGGASGCIEVAVKDGAVGIRDSKNRNGAVLVFNREEWSAFVAGVRADAFSVARD